MSKFKELPASTISISKRKLVCGIGINDATYNTSNGLLRCPYYETWRRIIARCYSNNFQERRPTYIGCTVTQEWLLFSNFKQWMEAQDWEGKQLDKDILVINNQIYSPETCIFVTLDINNLLLTREKCRGKYPTGVSFHKQAGKYLAHCLVNGKAKHLGLFYSIEIAEQRYKEFKRNLIIRIAKEQEPILKEALLKHADLYKISRKAEESLK